MKYDLGDCIQWEFMFPNPEKPVLSLPLDEPDIMDGLEDDEVGATLILHVLKKMAATGWSTTAFKKN